jgi:hypothetical protein
VKPLRLRALKACAWLIVSIYFQNLNVKLLVLRARYRKGSAITINASNCIVDGFKVTNSLLHWGEGGIKVQYYSGGNNIIKNNISFNNTQGTYGKW